MVQAALSVPGALRGSLALAAALLLGGCVVGVYQRTNVNEPRPDEVVRPLAGEPTTLAECLDALGAPNLVWPTADGTAMAWAHTHERGWGLRVSAAYKRLSGSVTYNSALEKAEALALFFDEEWKLLFLRRGKLADLLEEHPRRVQPVDPRRAPQSSEGSSKQ